MIRAVLILYSAGIGLLAIAAGLASGLPLAIAVVGIGFLVGSIAAAAKIALDRVDDREP